MENIMSKKSETPSTTAGHAVLFENLAEQYRPLLLELQEQDLSLLEKHLPNHQWRNREFADMVELGVDLASRRSELNESTDPDVKAYGAKLIPTFATRLQIAESALFHIVGSADLLGASTLRKLASDATKRGIKLTYSHVRELNCLSRVDHAEFIQEMLEKLLDGRIITHRQVKEAVETFLGRERVTLSRAKDQSDEDRALDRADAASASANEGDALDPLSTPGEIDTVCRQFVKMLEPLDKKLSEISEKITTWREDVDPDVLVGMCLDSLDAASAMSDEYAKRIKDVGLLLDETLRLATDVLKSEV
jgi:hypothetical protein